MLERWPPLRCSQGTPNISRGRATTASALEPKRTDSHQGFTAVVERMIQAVSCTGALFAS